MGQSTVSRQIAELEESLSTRLLLRSPRHISLTEAGEALMHHASAVVDDAIAIEEQIRSLSQEATGDLTVHAPVSFGRRYLGPVLTVFLSRHPQLTIDVTLSDEYVDLAASGVDVAIRIGRLKSGNYVARSLCENPRRICAAPEYIDRRGKPDHPSELAKHTCLDFEPLRTAGTWRIERDDGSETVLVTPHTVLRSNNADLLLEAALAGGGIGMPADFLIRDALTKGQLVELLPGWRLELTQIHVVYPDRAHLPAKTRAFIEHIVAAFRNRADWSNV